MAITFNDVTYQPNFWGIAAVSGTTAVIPVLGPDPIVISGTVNAAGDQVLLNGAVPLIATNLDDPNSIVFQLDATTFVVLSNTQLTAGQQIDYTNGSFDSAYVVPCFVAGTRILTRRGEVKVEELQVGDEAVAMVGGGYSRITWIGQRAVATTNAFRLPKHWPMKVRAGAFAPGVPHSDLLLSPDHAVFVKGSLIPVGLLENGLTVVRAPMDEVTYYHVELERHDVLLAEGLASESYLDTGNRADFDGVARDPAQAEAMELTARRVWAEKACAPLHVRGPVLAEARRMLEERAMAIGLGPVAMTELRLRVGGEEIQPRAFGDAWQFDLPKTMHGARLVSTAHVPAVTAVRSQDRRCLGVPVRRLLIDGKPVALDAPFLRAGWHDEADGQRWTTGMAYLPPLRTLTVLVGPVRPLGAAPDEMRTSAA